ncbi:50S ribosomal protein P1 [Candidatus Pacearchaeota archaeon]|nr:50S ribosomal protein P1 [Candidatus Pacearchaeota archaeon]
MEYLYAVLLLHKLGKPIDEEHLKKVVSAAGVNVDEAKIKTVVASLHGVDIEKELASASLAMAVSQEKPSEAKEEKKKEEKPSEAAEGLSSLFG